VVPELNDCSWSIGVGQRRDAFSRIDDYLADLMSWSISRWLGDLVRALQGGWLSLVYAGRFPAKVRKLVMVGTRLILLARQSELSATAEATPLTVFESLVNRGDGRLIGPQRRRSSGETTPLKPTRFANRCRRFSR